MRTEPRAFRFRPHIVRKIDEFSVRYSIKKTELVERAIEAYNGEVAEPKNVLQTKTFQVYEDNNVLFVKQKRGGQNE